MSYLLNFSCEFDGLKKIVQNYLDDKQIDRLYDAYLFAKEAHKAQFRVSGEPYITHPTAVASILASMNLDLDTLIAALLHDVIEDTQYNKEDLISVFGKEVAELVEGVSKLDKLKFRDKEEAQAENFRKMILAMVQDIRVILIKLSDRTHNIQTLEALVPQKRKKIAKETLDIYVPLANRLGIYDIKYFLEEHSFKYYYPLRYRVLKTVSDTAFKNRAYVIDSVCNEIQEQLKQKNIVANVQKRKKNIASIYKKMVSKEMQFQDAMDIISFRISVDSVDKCYVVLGAMHALYKPIVDRFKDYIAIPKVNGYQSLHTFLIGPSGVPIGVQIRTEDMDYFADKGVVANWLQKTKGQNKLTATEVKIRKWIQSLAELQRNTGTSQEFIENVKSDLYPEEIYVFTPKGQIIELPVNATPVDLAYAIHTDVGNSCIGAKINRFIYPLSQPLKSGQTVEIITSQNTKPHVSWLNFIVTAKARTKIRQKLKDLQRSEAILLGKRLLHHLIGDIDDIDKDIVQQLLEEYHLDSVEHLYQEIGLGNLISVIIANKLFVDKTITQDKKDDTQFSIKGIEGNLISFGKCCRPIPGDLIVAHVCSGKGVIIHTDKCNNVIKDMQSQPENYIAVEWNKNVTGEYLTELRIEVINQQGSLARITQKVAEEHSNIFDISSEVKDGVFYWVYLMISIKNKAHLSKVIKNILTISEIIRIERVNSSIRSKK